MTRWSHEKIWADFETLVTFQLGPYRLAAFADNATRVHADRETIPVPRAPAHIAGVVRLEGEFVPVVDLLRLFEQGATSSGRSRLLLLEAGTLRAVVRCHDIQVDAQWVGSNLFFGSADADVPEKLSSLLLGETESGGRSALVLDVKATLEAAIP